MEKLMVDILVQVNLLSQYINKDLNEVRVHFFLGEKKDDLVRQAYLLFSLARALVTTGKGDQGLVARQLQALSEKVWSQLAADRSNAELICAWMFILQANNLLYNKRCLSEEIEFLESLDFSKIYSHPTNICNLIIFIESQKLDDESYLSSIKNECYKVLDFIFFTNTIKHFPLFSIANVNYFSGDGKDTATLLHSLREYMLNNLKLDLTISSSGLAKCLEFLSLQFGNTKDLEDKILLCLKDRRADTHFLIGKADVFRQDLYYETQNSAHICLDTNCHLLNYYLNLYTKIYAENN